MHRFFSLAYWGELFDGLQLVRKRPVPLNRKIRVVSKNTVLFMISSLTTLALLGTGLTDHFIRLAERSG